MTVDEVIAELRREHESLQPAIAALDSLPALEQAAREARAAYRAWRDSPERPMYSSAPDHRAIELDGIASRASGQVETVSAEGRRAQHRANEITAMLEAPAEIVRGRIEKTELLRKEAEAKEMVSRADALVVERRRAIVDLNKRRLLLIEKGAEELLEGKPETTAKELAQIDAKLAIEQRALEGAERKHAQFTKAIEDYPEQVRLAEVTMRRAAARVAELTWKAALADAEASAAKFIAGQRLAGYHDEQITIRPRRELIDAAYRQCEAELRGEAA